jgi:hypothetical protein
VTGYQRKVGRRKLAIDDVQVRPADGASVNPDQDLIRLRLRDGSLLSSKGQARPVEDHRDHRFGIQVSSHHIPVIAGYAARTVSM